MVPPTKGKRASTLTMQRVGYMFFLSKQKGGPFDQCWMTDSVLRFKVDNV